MKKARKSVKANIQSQYKPKLKSKIVVKKQRIGARDIARKFRPLNDTEKILLDKALRKIEKAIIYGEGINRIEGGFANAKMTDSDKETIDVTLTWGVKNDKVDYSYPKELILNRKTMEVVKDDKMEKGGVAEDGKYQINAHGDKPTDYKVICRIIRSGGKDVQVCYHERNDHKERGVEVYSGKNYIVGSNDVSYLKKYDEIAEVPVKYKEVVNELVDAHHKKWDCGCSMEKGGKINKGQVKYFIEKFGNKMNGSSYQSSAYWVDGIGELSDDEKKLVWEGIQEYINRSTHNKNEDLPNWIKGNSMEKDGMAGRKENKKLTPEAMEVIINIQAMRGKISDTYNKYSDFENLQWISVDDLRKMQEALIPEYNKAVQGSKAKGGKIPDDIYWALYNLDSRLVDVDLNVKTISKDGSFLLTVGKAKEGTDDRHKGFEYIITKHDIGNNERKVWDYLNEQKGRSILANEMSSGGSIATGDMTYNDKYLLMGKGREEAKRLSEADREIINENGLNLGAPLKSLDGKDIDIVVGYNKKGKQLFIKTASGQELPYNEVIVDESKVFSSGGSMATGGQITKSEEKKIRECLAKYGFTEGVLIRKEAHWKHKNSPYWRVRGHRKDNIKYEYINEEIGIKISADDICKSIKNYVEDYNIKSSGSSMVTGGEVKNFEDLKIHSKYIVWEPGMKTWERDYQWLGEAMGPGVYIFSPVELSDDRPEMEFSLDHVKEYLDKGLIKKQEDSMEKGGKVDMWNKILFEYPTLKDEYKQWAEENDKVYAYDENLREFLSNYHADIFEGKMETGGDIKEGNNGYIAFYKGKQMEVYGDTLLQARDKAAAAFKARKAYDVTVVLAEKDGEQVTHVPLFEKGGVTIGYLNEFIDKINSEGGGKFWLEGSYGQQDLWAKDKDGGSHRIESGSKKDIYEALIRNRYNKKYNPKYADDKAVGGNIDYSGISKIQKLGLTDSKQFGDKYRDWLTKMNKINENGEYVGYQLSTHRDTITIIGKKGTVDFVIEDYENFPKSAKAMRATVVHYAKGGDVDDDFVVHGTYTESNAGGYDIMLSRDGGSAKVRDAFGSDNPKTSDWLEIEYVTDEEGDRDEDGELPAEPVIDPKGYDIPLNQVMRVNYSKGGKMGHKFRAYTILDANEYGQMRGSGKTKPTRFYISWEGNSYGLSHYEDRLLHTYVVFDNDEELKKAIDKVRYSSPTNVNYGLSPDQKFYKEYLPESEKFEYSKGGKAKNEKVITFSNSSHTSTKENNRKAWDELNEKLLNDKKNPLYNEFNKEDIILDTTDGDGYIPIMYTSMAHPNYVSEAKIKKFLEYLKGFISMDSHVYIGDYNYRFNNYLKPSISEDEDEFVEDEYSKGGKLKTGDYVSINLSSGKHYGKILGDYTDRTFYTGHQYGFEVEGIGDRIEPGRLHKAKKDEYEKYKKENPDLTYGELYLVTYEKLHEGLPGDIAYTYEMAGLNEADVRRRFSQRRPQTKVLSIAKRFANGGKLESLRSLIKKELNSHKDENYYASEADEQHSKKIFEMAINDFGYDVDDDPEASEWLLKATPNEAWQYWLDVIIPKLEKKKMEKGGNVKNITQSDIHSGNKFRFKDGTVFIVDEVKADKDFGISVRTSLEGGKKGNYRDSIEEVVAFFNEEGAVKIKSSGGSMENGGNVNDIQVLKKDATWKEVKDYLVWLGKSPYAYHIDDNPYDIENFSPAVQKILKNNSDIMWKFSTDGGKGTKLWDVYYEATGGDDGIQERLS